MLGAGHALAHVRARARGLKARRYWVKSSLAPGSPSSGDGLFHRRQSVLQDLAAVGFDLRGLRLQLLAIARRLRPVLLGSGMARRIRGAAARRRALFCRSVHSHGRRLALAVQREMLIRVNVTV